RHCLDVERNLAWPGDHDPLHDNGSHRDPRHPARGPPRRTPPGRPVGWEGLVTADRRTLTVRHVTVYRYSEPVRLGEHRMMFRPRESHDLRLLDARLDIQPRPTRLRWLHDVFDNSVAIATFDGSTTELRFDSLVT